MENTLTLGHLLRSVPGNWNFTLNYYWTTPERKTPVLDVEYSYSGDVKGYFEVMSGYSWQLDIDVTECDVERVVIDTFKRSIYVKVVRSEYD